MSSKRLPRRLQDVFVRPLAIMSSRRLQDVFARRLAITSSRLLQRQKMLHWRRLGSDFYQKKLL